MATSMRPRGELGGLVSSRVRTCRNIRPTIPAAAVYTAALDVAVSSAIYGQTTPQKAMQSVAAQVNTALDEYRKERP